MFLGLFVLGGIFLAVLYGIYCYTFRVDAKRLAGDEEIPDGDVPAGLSEYVHNSIELMKKTPSQSVSVVARDGVKLYGRFYHIAEGAPVVICFHGYRSSALRDGMGAFKLGYNKGYNVLLVDQRAHRESAGRTITFGVKERLDCLEWIAYILAHHGMDTPIFLAGLSMGAATVLMATGLELPENVKGILADCAYSTPKDILKISIGMMKLPVAPVYFLVRLSAKIFGGFDPEEASVKEALKKCKVPVLFVHGEADRMVPCSMCRENYEACAAEKELLLVPEADHGMSYALERSRYEEMLNAFADKYMENRR